MYHHICRRESNRRNANIANINPAINTNGVRKIANRKRKTISIYSPVLVFDVKN